MVSPWFSGQFCPLPSGSFWHCLETCGCHKLGEGDGDAPGVRGGRGGVRGCCVTSHSARDRPTPESDPALNARDARVETPALSSAVNRAVLS